MKIAFVLHFYDEGLEAEQMVSRHYSTVCLVEALAQVGNEVHVFYRFSKDHYFVAKKVHYHFIQDSLPGFLKPWHSARAYNHVLTQQIKELGIEVIHANNIYRPVAHHNLAKANANIPYIVQDHGGLTKVKYPWIQRPFLRLVDLFLLSAKGMEIPILEAKLAQANQFRFIMEASSEMSFVADGDLVLKGKPCFLWIGNLNSNKDPMTVLKAFKTFAKKDEDAHLHMIYKQTFLEEEIKNYISTYQLADRVTLYGFIDRNQISRYLSAADYFVAASHKEGSGYALMEAMSCGLTPILTSIPSFIELTKNASIGYLYTVGDHQELAHIFETCARLAKPSKAGIIDHFNRHFSYEALAHQLSSIYREAIHAKS